jgi:ATP-dependent RNA helicase RhlE
MTDSIQSAVPSSDIPSLTFAEIGLHPQLLQSVVDTGYTTPTPIQAQALPAVMSGRDVMGAAQTGTGKTAAFTLPILHRLMPSANTSASPARHPVRALILAPTRELADQVYESVKRYSKHTPLRSAVVYGGVDIGPQKEALRRGCEVLVATPGRLLDHIEQKTVSLSQVGIIVLDEADRMLDMGFLPDLDRIVRLLPAKRQGLLFSATFSNEIRKLGRTFLNQPVEIEVAARNATADTVTQIAYQMPSEAKLAAVVHLVKSRGLKQVIVFSNTKIGTARLARELERDGVRAESIHGDKSQADRMKALEAFKSSELEVLVATDVAARGLDVAGVPCVINYDLPHNAEDYVHRIGRTGRAGASGEAIAFFTPDEERYLLDIEKLIERPVPRGKLEVPRELVVRSHTREPRTRERRSHSPSFALSGQRSNVDELFYKPYIPSAQPAVAAASAAEKRAQSSKRDVGVLLGGGRKPREA